MVRRAAEAGGSVVNFVPTHYWRGGGSGRDSRDKGEPVQDFCYMDRWVAGGAWDGDRGM